MKFELPRAIDRLSENPKLLFLVDALGALLTAFLLGVILAQFETLFGMPEKPLYVLALIACLFAIFSAHCHFFVQKHRPYLAIIMTANLAYCGTTLLLMIYYFQELTLLGIIYFLIEIAVIILLVMVERKAFANLKKTS